VVSGVAAPARDDRLHRATFRTDHRHIGGIVLLGEVFTRDIFVASVLILGSIWLVLRYGKV